MIKVKLKDTQFWVDTSYDAGTIVWLPDRIARVWVDGNHAEFWTDGVPEPESSKQGIPTVQTAGPKAKKPKGNG